MAKITGRNALVYIGGSVAPARNQVTINYNLELQEARDFQPVVAGGPWSEQIPGFRNWTININGYYDDANSLSATTLSSSDTPLLAVVYETRANLSRYWYGYALFTMTEEIGVDDVISLNMSGTGHKELTRIPAS